MSSSKRLLNPTVDDVARWIALPRAGDDKYSRGVLGVVTGSERFPGAAVLGVEAAARTGVGMTRYLGGAAAYVLQRRPETVTVAGQVQAWLIGSGTDAEDEAAYTPRFREALDAGVPVIADAGALGLVASRHQTGSSSGRGGDSICVVTPHYRELARMFAHRGQDVEVGTIAGAPADWAARAAESFGATVLLKGATTYVSRPDGRTWAITDAPAWLATAGTGDVLGGILGALLATNSHRLTPDTVDEIVAAGAVLHVQAARMASRGAPITALDLAEEIQPAVRSILRSRP